ncbi:Sugar/inositol transporter [Corchorus olitorius]|uniref:Sugar/inositol transporter n=1 Tax=Corchorus olitorius TaxID=93759 RepID=A0A1R3KRF4_9ROSI|nr:Sugar/inositol transporter [Corchorus olitorius]
MAGGAILPPGGGSGKEYPGKFTGRVFFTCIIAATGGLIFGYDLGISGGVTSMDSFLEKFFPDVYRKEISIKPSDNQYCKFDSQKLTFFTSSLYLAALVSSLVASPVTRLFGRRLTMMFGGLLFAIGALLNGFAQDLAMLYIGRILLGCGVGAANQSVPIYLSEMAPFKYRGALNIMFQITVTFGIFVANLLNYFTAKIKDGWGWRLSLGGAFVPGVIICLGSLCLSDTPNSLIERGKLDEAKDLLKKIRGIDNIDEEFHDLVAASEASKLVKHPWRDILKRKHRPQLSFAILIPAFQQLTGVNVFVFYAPVLFKSMGFGNNASLISSMITSIGIFIGAIVSSLTAVMTIAIGVKFGTSGNPGELPMWYAAVLVVAMCIYIAGFGWSWGPLGWLVPSEIFPLEIRSAAQSINVAVNMIFTFAVAQAFTKMLCHLKFGLFIFFASCVAVMTIFVYNLLPETKGVPIEAMTIVWKNHPYWSKFVKDEDTEDYEMATKAGSV